RPHRGAGPGRPPRERAEHEPARLVERDLHRHAAPERDPALQSGRHRLIAGGRRLQPVARERRPRRLGPRLRQLRQRRPARGSVPHRLSRASLDDGEALALLALTRTWFRRAKVAGHRQSWLSTHFHIDPWPLSFPFLLPGKELGKYGEH